MNKLSIGIDGYNMAMPRGTGVATYGLGLARAVAELGHSTIGVFGIDVGRDPKVREAMLFDRFGQEPRRTTRYDKRRLIFRSTWLPARWASEVPLSDLVEKREFSNKFPAFDRIVSYSELFQLAELHFRFYGRFLPLKIKHPPAIMHWTYPVPIRLVGSRNIYTLHDLVPLRLPYTTLDLKASYSRIIEGCVKHAAHICTVSQSSLADIVSRYPSAAEKITNTYQIAPIPTHILEGDPATDAEMIEGLFSLKRRGYFLFFGALDPKKNIVRIIEAYLGSQSKTPLVIVGAHSWGTAKESAMLGGGKVSMYGKEIEERILQLDYLPRELLMRLIRGAKAVLCPSLFEGFGLPALEAIQLGTPVISSNVSSLPEVVGDAGILVDPYDVRAISAAILALDGDSTLSDRLLLAGPAQVAKFSSQAYKQKLETMYDRATRGALSQNVEANDVVAAYRGSLGVHVEGRNDKS